MTELSGWENFYVIVGSSAGALIGLQFVVMTLIATRPMSAPNPSQADAFATPTIVHFGCVLLVSAAVAAPWHSIGAVAIFLGALGFSGLAYCTLVTRRLMPQVVYKLQCEDWLFHVLLPFATYATLAASAFAIRYHAHEAMFAVAGCTLLLLFGCIHNAWDAVTYHIFVKSAGHNEDKRAPK